VKHWLENQTSSILTPVHAQAKKLREDMNMAIQGVGDVSKMLLDNSTREIERRNMRIYNRARALNKLAHLFLDRLKKLNLPEEISYDTVSRYAQEIQKVLMVTEIDIKNWFPRISPFFIMDRRKFLTVYERAKQAYAILNDFVTKEYIKTKTLEEAFQLLNELQNVQKQLETIGEEKEKIKNERIPIEKEITELEQKIGELKNSGPIDKLNLVNAEIDALSNELKHSLRYLQKPFIKMQALATSGGGGGITPDELSKVNQYLEKPLDAFTTEENGYPMLKQILQKLENLMAEDKLKLKQDKARKAEQSLNEILRKDSLAKLQIRCVEMATTKEQLLASSKMDEIKRSLSVFQEQVDQLKARKTSIETHEAVKENAYNEALEKISNLKRSIERNIYSSIEIKVQIP
jgi:DNA repair exonuclease SbcCD ATPase subunit